MAMFRKLQTGMGLLCLSLAALTGAAQTANTTVPSYSSPFQYGVNGAYAGNNWTDETLAKAASNAGVNSIRVGLYDFFLEQYGTTIRKPTFDYYSSTLHFSDNIVFLNGAADDHVDKTVYPGCSQHSLVFKNIYQPIWITDASGKKVVNPQNYYAQYVYNVAANYGGSVKFFEVWNEPDFTYGSNGYAQKGTPGNWFDNAPQASDLTNLYAPVYYYIRMLHIAYEVIKSVNPNSMVATGGLGYSSFLDVLLRYTDNPDNGKVSAEYPVTGGAYFDVLSFHSYPFYELGNWSNTANGMVYTRHSDGNTDRFLVDMHMFTNVLNQYQYNGSKYPAKYYICTETNIPSLTNPANAGQYGTPELQRNYIIKTLVQAQVNNVKQLYLYALDNGSGASPMNPNDYMGLYTQLAPVSPGQEKLTDEGIAFQTTSAQLHGLTYDPGLTNSLGLTSKVSGAVFSGILNGVSTHTLVLWARTTIDQSEAANATFSIPASMNLGSSLKEYAWNAGKSATNFTSVNPASIALTGAPVFLVSTGSVTKPVASVVASAGVPQTITLPVSSVNLNAAASTASNTTISSYAWKQVQGPSAATLSNINTASAKASNLKQGNYTMQVKVADNSGHADSSQVSISVNADTTTPPPPPPPSTGSVTANAGPAVTITLPINYVKLDGTASTATNTTIASYLWTQVSGPNQAAIQFPTIATPTLWALQQGNFVFNLVVTDTQGHSSSSNVSVTVNGPAVPAPSAISVSANAGPDRTITLPMNYTQLDGTQSTATGTTISGYTWTQISGPNSAAIQFPNGSKATLWALQQGSFVFQLTVTDGNGHSSSANVDVTVNGPGLGSVANDANQATQFSGQLSSGNGISDPVSSPGYSLYPNPATSRMNLIAAYNQTGPTSLEVYSVTGKRISSQSVSKNGSYLNQQLDVSGLLPGVYILKIITGNTMKSVNFIKN